MKKIVIISGDPNSINAELIYKSIKKLNKDIRKKIYLISNYRLIKSQLKKLNYELNLLPVENPNQEEKSNNVKIINVKLDYDNPFNVKNAKASKYVLESLNLAHKYANSRNDIGIINCPIDKKLLKSKKTGVTEYLAKKSKIKKDSEVMLIKNEKLAVCPITTHIDIKDISKELNQRKIFNKIVTIKKWYKKKLNKNPKIGVMGLNPHNAELRKNSEEIKIIIPTIKKLKKIGFLIKGPLVADTIFINNFKNYDVLIGMFHDQVLAPFKSMFKFNAINLTLGLKYIRVSPDHGVAKDLIFKKKANPESLLKCINFLNRIK